MEKLTLTYFVIRRTEGGYTHDRLVIREQRKVDVNKAIAGCVDNAAGYGSAEAASKMLRVFSKLRKDGHKHYYDTAWSGMAFEIDYQVYQLPTASAPIQYCEPRIEFPNRIGACQKVLKFLEKIGKRIEKTRAAQRSAERGYDTDPYDVSHDSFESLSDVLAALDAAAVRVKSWAWDGDTWARYDVEDKPTEAASDAA